MTLPKHMDKFRDDESPTENMVDKLPECEDENPSIFDQVFGCAPRKPVYVQHEVMRTLDGDSFRQLKILSFNDLRRNCLIDDEFIMVMLDRISALEKQVKELKQ